MAEFTVNNAMNKSTKMSPFFANYGFYPRMSFYIPPRGIKANALKHIKKENLLSTSFADRIEEIYDVLRSNLLRAQER